MNSILQLTKTTYPLSLQDSGRYGYACVGVAPSGVMDAEAAKLANRLVGNYADEVLLEYAIGGLELEVLSDCMLGILGAGGMNESRLYEAGETISIPPRGDCLWGYIAVCGGFETDEILGSRSAHSRSGIGEVVMKGSQVKVSFSRELVNAHTRWIAPQELEYLKHKEVIRLVRGIHLNLLDEVGFTDKQWKISSSLDRSGYRLDGEFISHEVSLPSLPVIPGTIQMTPSGQPIITMPDGPTVGGYPVLGVVAPRDLHKLVQRPPGTDIKFEWIDVN